MAPIEYKGHAWLMRETFAAVEDAQRENVKRRKAKSVRRAPYDPTPGGGQHLRDSIKGRVDRQGNTVWGEVSAGGPGVPHAGAQEAGYIIRRTSDGTERIDFQHYTTPGTGAGFLAGPNRTDVPQAKATVARHLDRRLRR